MEHTNYTETLPGFPVSEKNMSFSSEGEDFFRSRKKRSLALLTAALPVNNYLKTPEEIETEFLCSFHTHKSMGKDMTSEAIAKKITMDGYTDIHELDEAFSGFMEENY